MTLENDRLITVAIHTYDKAIELKSILEREGVAVVLQNVNLSTPTVSPGVRMRIHESDLPQALRIIENTEIFVPTTSFTSDTTSSATTILVPVDFSNHSMNACRLAFNIASRHSSRIIFLHSFVPPERFNLQLSASLSFTSTSVPNDKEELIDSELYRNAKRALDEFLSKIRQLIKNGELPPVSFTGEVVAGVPEDAILDFSKNRKPTLIVMGTRGILTKERELIGSVTAEVLDSCRQPVFTLPSDSSLSSLDNIKDVVLLCDLDQNDMLALEGLSRLVGNQQLSIHLIQLTGRRLHEAASKVEIDMMLQYCRSHYPTYDFSMDTVEMTHALEYFKRLEANNQVSLIVVPSRKKTLLSRLFNPSLAHKLLFRADVPLMAIPV